MRLFLLFLLACCAITDAQGFADYRIRYGHFQANDPAAFEYLNPYIKKAKRENNRHELFQAYKDAVHFTYDHKLSYADSALTTALSAGDSLLIATAHLTKGTVYYFRYRKFQHALDEYLQAWRFTRKSDDGYLYYKNLYHFGVVKSYLGHYADALAIFKECIQFFGREQERPEPANIKRNRIKAHLNTQHQMAVCLVEMGNVKHAAAIGVHGLAEIGAQSDFYLERSYFYKIIGIAAYRERQYSAVIPALDNAMPGMLKKNDFTNASVVYFYKGKTYAQVGNRPLAIHNFRKVDSIFVKYGFILPEVRESYEYLIDFSEGAGNSAQELYYTKQLLKADRILMADFKDLFPKIQREYDTPELLRRQQKIESPRKLWQHVRWGLGLLLLAGVLVFVFRQKLPGFLRAFPSGVLPTEDVRHVEKNPDQVQSVADTGTRVPDKVAQKVLAKLKALEERNFFTDSSMTLHKLAPMLNTNTAYLSTIIKDYRGCSYPVYIKTLRMEFVTRMLREDKDWRSLTVQNLAKACGIEDRTSFTNAFLEHNKMKPVDFICQIRHERSDGKDQK